MTELYVGSLVGPKVRSCHYKDLVDFAFKPGLDYLVRGSESSVK